MSRRTQLAAMLFAALVAREMASAQAPKPPVRDARGPMTREMSDRLWTEFGAALKKGDVPAIMAVYTDDIVAIDPDQPTVVGKPAMTEVVKGFMTAGRVTEHSHVLEGFEAAGDMAIEHGHWRFGFLEKGKTTPAVSDARYIIVWKRAPDGKWLLHRDVSIPNPPKAATKKAT
jgi:ketosteroid isomerase-like protein